MAVTNGRQGEGQPLRLLLLRHAKSAWPEGVVDEERPLNGRGREAARLVGAYLAREGLVPDLALVSTARRTQETWALVSGWLEPRPNLRSEPALYAASPEEMLDVLKDVGAGPRTVLMLAHNPGTQELALALAGSAGDGRAIQAMAEKYPTAGLAILDLSVPGWSLVAPGCGRLERFVTPRSLA